MPEVKSYWMHCNILHCIRDILAEDFCQNCNPLALIAIFEISHEDDFYLKLYKINVPQWRI